LIDYVILHELTHTKVLAHGPKFWSELESVLPSAKVLKKDINKYKPTVDTSHI
jgi:predicted metal-dependent hydrolase